MLEIARNQGRIPPHSLDAERALVASVLMAPEKLADMAALVKPEHFYRPSYGQVFAAMLSLLSRSVPLDEVSLIEELGGDQTSVELVRELWMYSPSAANTATYAKIVREKALLRRMIETGHRIVMRAYEDQGDTRELVSECQREILAVADEATAVGAPVHVRDVLKATMIRLQSLYERQTSLTGLSTGIDALDALTGGLHPGQLVILGARPKMGKTSLALQMALSAAGRGNVSALLFSLEMTTDEIGPRLLANEGRVDGQRMRSASFADSDWGKIAGAAARIADVDLWIDDSMSSTIHDFSAKARRLAQKLADTAKPLGLIIVDYLQLAGQYGENREQEIAAISRGLKALAKELSLPVLALSQLNRGLDKRQDRRPQPSDLRDSGSIEQDADAVLFLYRDEEYNPASADQGIAEIIVSLQRNGPKGTVRCSFVAPFMRFEALSTRSLTDHHARNDE